MKLSTLTPIFITFVGTLCLSAQAPDGYVLDWADEFDYTGAPNPEFWTHEIGGGGWGNQETQIYTDSLENSRVEDGKLIIEAHQVLGSRTPGYSSARIITREKVQWKYGRMEVRAKMPDATGTWPAIWMLAADRLYGNGGWPDNGEIDIVELVGYEQDPLFKALKGDPELPNIHGTIHTFIRNGQEGGGIGDKTYIADASTAFHTYAVNWTEDRLEWEVDGVLFHSWDYPTFRGNPPEDISQYWPFDQRFFMILNVAVGGQWGAHFNANAYPDDSPYPRGINEDENVWPQRMEVEYVRVYRQDVPPESTPIPGMVLATDLDHSDGILIKQSVNLDIPHTLTEIDPQDSAEFSLEAPLSGLYTISATVASESGRDFDLHVPETGASIQSIQVPATGDFETWQSVEIGEIALQQGVNTLIMSTSTGVFNLAAFELTGDWKGLPIDAAGNANTGSWLGVINVTTAPWIHSSAFDNYIYMPAAKEEVFSTDSQWIYIPK